VVFSSLIDSLFFTFLFFFFICSKILSLVASFFAAVYVTKWKEFFPQRKLLYAPSFSSKVVSCASAEVLQAYLAWRQQDCHANNQYDTCFWMLVKSGKSVSETQEILKVCYSCFSMAEINVFLSALRL
jgi:tRNA(His) guanylyltransferase